MRTVDIDFYIDYSVSSRMVDSVLFKKKIAEEDLSIEKTWA